MRKFWMVKWATFDMDMPTEDSPGEDRVTPSWDRDRASYVEHPTLQAAMVEANRMARKSPERTFVVLEAIKAVKAEIDIAAKEWIGDGLFQDHRDYEREAGLKQHGDDVGEDRAAHDEQAPAQ